MTTSSEFPDAQSTLGVFLTGEGFQPDAFQLKSFAALDAGRNLLVSAPTGSGKTLGGEYAAFRSLSGGGRCFYTTPVKALSNQKFRQFRRRFGAENEIGRASCRERAAMPWPRASLTPVSYAS